MLKLKRKFQRQKVKLIQTKFLACFGDKENSATLICKAAQRSFSSTVVPKRFFLTEPFGLRKITTFLRQITTDPHILAHVNIVCMDDDRYTELNIYFSELVVDSYQYIPVAYVTVHCMI